MNLPTTLSSSTTTLSSSEKVEGHQDHRKQDPIVVASEDSDGVGELTSSTLQARWCHNRAMRDPRSAVAVVVTPLKERAMRQ